MKIRQGFVSNSSSSSFCVFGVMLEDPSEILEAFPQDPENPEPGCKHSFDRENMKFCPECGAEAWLEPEEDDPYEVAEENGYHYYECEDGYAFGVEIEAYTLSELKKLDSTAKKLKKLFGKEAKVISGEYAC